MLLQKKGNDYVLPEGKSCWITVGSTSVYITNNAGGGGQKLEVYRKEKEDQPPLVEVQLESLQRNHIANIVVAGVNSSTGSPDFAFVRVRCRQLDYESEDYTGHYEAAENWLRDSLDFEGPFVSFSDNDGPFDWLFERFEWDTASIIEAGTG